MVRLNVDLFSSFSSGAWKVLILLKELELLGSLRNDGGDGKENGKNEIGLDKQNNNFARPSCCFLRSSAVVARLQRETTH